jgi:signal transduction histidine kinase
MDLLPVFSDFFRSAVSFALGWELPLILSGLLAVLIALFLYTFSTTKTIKYQFLTTGSHKFRTPLSKIKVAVTELIDKKEAADTRGEQYVMEDYDERMIRQVLIEANRLVGLVNLLLEVTETERGHVRYDWNRFDIVELMREILDGYQKSLWRNDRTFLTFEVSESQLFVKADRHRISTVIQVLLENALMYTQGGGKIAISVFSQEGKVVVSVADKGIGIIDSERRYVFKKFYRSKRAIRIHTEGVGIGLFLAKRIVREHGGRMWFESEGEHRGSMFSFTLPLSKQ